MKTSQIQITVSDILSGEEPPESGYYMVIGHTSGEQEYLDVMYWHADKHAWGVNKSDDDLMMPTVYWGRYWANNFMREVAR